MNRSITGLIFNLKKISLNELYSKTCPLIISEKAFKQIFIAIHSFWPLTSVFGSTAIKYDKPMNIKQQKFKFNVEQKRSKHCL